ncbi:methylmalonyl-CoA mutase family protein [Chloroflexota bacterium]
MFDEKSLLEIERRRQQWEGGTLRKSLDRFGASESPNKYYTPLDIRNFDFLDKLGFPGEYPFTAGVYPCMVPGSGPETGGVGGGGLVRAGGYTGYATAEDTRDYYINERVRGRKGGPNLAFDLPTQLGLDSDNTRSRGEVGRTGVAVDTLEDFEIIYEAFQGENDLDKISSAWTINAPANIILAMYVALSEKRGISLSKLRSSPQNDILKEYIARGTYIFPPRPSLRLFRDSLTYCTEHMPLTNVVNIGGYHIREAGATRVQTLAFTLSNAIAYMQTGIDAGLEPDSFLPRFVLYSMSGSMELLKEIAAWRALRRMWANITRFRFGAKNPRSWILRSLGGSLNGYWTATSQRPLNNLTRAVLGGFAGALCSDIPRVAPCYDEPLGLGWSTEGRQLSEDAARIIQYEAKLAEVSDPLAGSYYIESMTDQIEKETMELIKKIDDMGGSVAAIERGYMQRSVAQSAYEYQRRFERCEEVVVGVNAFTDEHQLEVLPNRSVPDPYDPEKRDKAEEKQIRKLGRVRSQRDNNRVNRVLADIRKAASDEKTNLIPLFVGAVKAYATIGEICGVLREVFGEYSGYGKV